MEEPPFTPELLRLAYSRGFFPMPHPDTGETLWLSPDPRAVIPLDGFHVSRSLARTLKRSDFTVTVDQDFRGVMAACADRQETWITDQFKDAYGRLHDEGDAHSLEVWHGGRLAGGVYGIALGGAFFGESMFHTVTDMSKVALFHLVERLKERGFVLLEVQFLTPHLQTLGTVEIPRHLYLRLLQRALPLAGRFAP